MDGNGYPLAVVPAPGNVHDATLLAPTLAARVRPAAPPATQTLIMDRGYRGIKQRRTVEQEGYIYRAPPRNRKDPYRKLDQPLSRAEKRARGFVERCHAWLQNYRAILTRHSRLRASEDAMVNIASILLWYNHMATGEMPAENVFGQPLATPA